MKQTIKSILAFAAVLLCGGAWASQLYVDKLDTGTERIPNGTYGEGDSSIVVPGYGIKATTYSALTQINHKNDNPNLAGTWTGDLQIAEHTISAWFKISALPTDANFSTIYADRSETEGAYGGYKLGVNSSGKLKVGRINGGNYGYNDGVTYNSSLQADTWYYITVSMVKNGDNCQPAVYVNGVAQTVDGTTTTFAHGMNGNRYLKFMIGANVSVAGLYADDTAITDASDIKGLAVSSDKVSIIHLAQLVNKADGAVEATYDAIESSITINEGKEFQIVTPLDGSVMNFSSSVSGAGDLRFVGIPEQRTLTDQLTGTATAYDVLNNVSVDAIIPRSAILTGTSITGDRQEATIHNVKRGNGSLTFCAHTIDGSYLKVVKVEMTQDGANVKAKRVWGHYVSSSSVPKETDWCSFTGSDNTGYQIKEIVFDVVGGVNLAATSANNASFTGKTIIDNCFVKTSVPGSLSDTVQVINGGELSVANGTGTGGNYNNAGYGITYEAQTGSRITFAEQNFVAGYNDTLFANGGTIEYIAGSWGGKNMYVGNLKLAEGGVIAGGGLIRLGNYVNSSVTATGNSLICNAQIQPYSAGSTRKTVTFDVDEAALLTVYTSVAKPADNGYDNVDLKKTGAGTIYFKRCQTNTANTEPMTISGGVVKGGYDTFCSTITVEEGGAYSISAATSKTISGAGEIWITANNLSFASATLTLFTGHIVIKSGVTYTCAPSALPAKLKIEPNGTWAYTHEGKSVTIAATDATKSLYYENGVIKIANAEVTSVDVTKLLYPGISSVDVSECTALAEVYVGSSGDFSAEFAKVTGVGNDVTIVVVETPAEYANGALTISNVPAEMVSRIKVKRPGIAELVTPIAGPEANTLTINDSTIKISGAATSFDITYTNSQAFVYKAVSGATSQADSTITYNKQGEGHDVGARLKHHPYINNIGNAWFEATEALTLAVVGTMPTANRTSFIHMGDSNSGYTGLLIATGDKKDEVIIAWNSATTVTEITRMSVPNAASERHVYVVTKSDVGDKSTFTVYLDSKKWKTVTIDRITIKGGVQVGSDFGGKIHGLDPSSANYFAAVASTDDSGLVNVIRVYDRVITKAEIDEYSTAEQYPYYPPHGSSAREFTGETANWIESDDPAVAWSVTPKDGSATHANAPAEGSSLSTTLSAVNTAITVNVPADGIIYEELEVIGSGAATFVKGAESGAISISGAATLYRPITVKPGAIDLSKTPITLLEDGALTFDYSDYDVTTTYVTTKVNLTGEVAQNDSKITFTPPTNKPYRTVEMSYDTGLKQYVMTITPNHENGATIYYDSTTAVRGDNAAKIWSAAVDPKVVTCAFPGDTIVFGYGTFHRPSWFNPCVVGSVFEFAKDMTISYATDDTGKLFDGKTIKVDGKTLTLEGNYRNIQLGTITTIGTNGKIVFTVAAGQVHTGPTADAISGTAKIVVSDGITLTVTGSVGSPVEVNGTIKAGSEIATITTTKPNCFVKVTVADGVYTYTPVEVTGEVPLPLDDIKPGESVTPAQDAKPIWSDTTPVEGEGGKYIKVVDGALVVKSGAPANGLDSFKSYVLGLDPDDATSKPYLSGADTTSATTLKLIPAGVSVKEGYAVTSKLRVGTTPTSFSDDSTELTDGGFTITLPTEENDKVKYYQIEYTISK